ncbi:MAG TPA: OmpH family outer membrane protein [Puia sp.]|jgi:outer membrane protein
MKSLRINTLLLATVLAAVLVLVYFFAFANNNKIVYVDSGKLLNGYKGMVEARKEYDKKRAAWQANVDTLTSDVQTAIKKYSKDLANGSDKEKQMSRDLIQTKQKALIDYQNVIKQNAAQEEERLNQEVFNTVNAFLLRYGKKHGYKMILIAANGNIAYADPSMEITDRIVEELNKEYAVPVK